MACTWGSSSDHMVLYWCLSRAVIYCWASVCAPIWLSGWAGSVTTICLGSVLGAACNDTAKSVTNRTMVSKKIQMITRMTCGQRCPVRDFIKSIFDLMTFSEKQNEIYKHIYLY